MPTQKGTPCGVGAHVDETGIVEEDVIGKEDKKRDCKKRCDPFIENREGTECGGQALSCLRVPFFMVKRPVDQTQKGTPYGVGIHVQNGHRR